MTCLAVLLLFLGGCTGSALSNREGGALGGAAVGAGLGAIIGSATGRAGVGTAIGGGIGALSGALVGNELDKSSNRSHQMDDQLSRNEEMIRENERLLESLRKKGYDAYPSDRGVVINLPDVLFPFNSADLTSRAQRDVAEIAETLRSLSDRHISIEGHTDSIGSPLYNQRLSERRAGAVKSALSASGISNSNLSSRGFGESDPVASNGSSEGRQRNRRVEVIVENS